MTCTADSEYIRAVSVKYKRCPSSYSIRSALARTGFEVKPLQRPKTALQTVPPLAQPRPPTARVQKEKNGSFGRADVLLWQECSRELQLYTSVDISRETEDTSGGTPVISGDNVHHGKSTGNSYTEGLSRLSLVMSK